MNIDRYVDAFVEPVATTVKKIVFFEIEIFGTQLPLVVMWLILAALFFTFYLKFINIRGFFTAIRLVSGKSPDASSAAPGEISHFRALCTAISGTVGIGNIGGVAVALSMGGPGAAFWLFVAGFLGMSTKFIECTLGVMYRRENADGSVSGGPMYYLQRGLGVLGWKRAGRALGIFYAVGIVICCMGIGNMFQSNQAYVQLVNVTGGEQASWFAERGWLFGLTLAVLLALVIIRGIRGIAQVAAFLVPFMALLYLLSALAVIVLNFEAIPWAFSAIVSGAFTADSVAGGALGAMIIGFTRAAFSNEAGIGSAAIAHSAVRTNRPITEGYVSLLEPFVDTIVICMITALVVVTTQYYNPDFASDLDGIQITSAAFARSFSWFPAVLAVAAILFAFSTILAWSYYGLKGWTYLTGEKRGADLGFKLVFCGFVMLGSMIELKSVLDFSDAFLYVIAVPNILGLYILAPQVKRAMKDFQRPSLGPTETGVTSDFDSSPPGHRDSQPST